MGKCIITFEDGEAGEIDLSIVFDPPMHKEAGQGFEECVATRAQQTGAILAKHIVDMMNQACPDGEDEPEDRDGI